MTWTDKEREESADACAMMASSYHADGLPPALFLTDAADPDGRAYTIAALCVSEIQSGPPHERWAEAEARLRCGWTPGDEP